MPPTIVIYALAFAGSMLIAWATTPLAKRLARRMAVLDAPGALKAQSAPVPYLGGAAIVTAFAVSVVAANLVVPPVGGLDELGLVLGLALVLAAVGLVDDLRGLGPFVRLMFELGAAVALVVAGVSVQAFDAQWLNAVVTVVWVAGLTNAFNLLDNMDGLSAGTAAIAAASFFVIAALNGQFLVASLAIALAGCAVGFLRHNFHPATIYMGDAGSLFIGFVLAVVGLKLRFDGPTSVTFLVPILVCGVAIFDTILVTIERLKHGRSPLSGGRDHISHRLTVMGLPVPWTVTVVYTAGMALGWSALVVSRVDRISAYLLTGLIVMIALIIGRLLSHVPVYRPTNRRILRLREQTIEDAQASEWVLKERTAVGLDDDSPEADDDSPEVAEGAGEGVGLASDRRR